MAKSVHILGMLLFFQLVHGKWPQTGREGPGVERKVRALVKSQHENMIAPSAFSKVLMLHFSLHAVTLANNDKTKVEKEQ